MPLTSTIILDLPGFKIIRVSGLSDIIFHVEYTDPILCPHCHGKNLRKKESFLRRIRHILCGQRPTWLEVKAHKYYCRGCKRYFNSRFPGIKPRLRASEPCRLEVTKLHHNGWTQRSLSQHLGVGSATIERWYQSHFVNKNREYENAPCPKVMGIDEHFFTRKGGYATTVVDLAKHKVFDVVLGRSELALRPFCRKLLGKDRVRVVVMDLSETYRSIAKQHFKNAMIVADRFHVIRLVNQQFIKTWGEIDEEGRKNRGLLSLMRRHPDRMRIEQRTRLYEYLDKTPGLKSIYLFWQDLLRLLRMKCLKRAACKKILTEYLWIIEELKKVPFKHLQTLGNTLERWNAHALPAPPRT
jgi:transposase